MKKIMLASLAVVGIFVLAILSYDYILGRANDVAITIERDEGFVMLDRSNVNLLETDPATGQIFAYSFVAEIPEYIVIVPDFTLPESFYPDFIQTWFCPFDVSAEYTSDSTNSHIQIVITVYDSANTAQEVWAGIIFRSLLAYIPLTEAHGIVVGDVAFGFDEGFLYFIRGNILARIYGQSPYAAAVAQELDAQIIAALREVARNQ